MHSSLEVSQFWPWTSQASSSSRTTACELVKQRLPPSTARTAFIGSNIGPAGEYHDSDFTFEVRIFCFTNAPIAQKSIYKGQASHPGGDAQSRRSAIKAHRRCLEEAGAQLAADDLHSGLSVDNSRASTSNSAECWENFHLKDNSTAKFYKERRYLLLEFPVLKGGPEPQHIVELGCGAGSSLIPILKANTSCRVTGTDLSPTAVNMFKDASKSAGIAADRVSAFAFDSTDVHAKPHPLHGLEGDVLLLIFTLAALQPAQMPALLHNVFQAVRPGGLLLVRDHGLYDLTHLRLREHQRVGPRLFKRQDGTLCYFFTTEALQEVVTKAGFETMECKYACVSLQNRKRGLQMRRVFVHGVFRRPL